MAANSTQKYLLVLAGAGILLFGVAGIGLYGLYRATGPKVSNETTTATNVAAKTPEPTPKSDESVFSPDESGEFTQKTPAPTPEGQTTPTSTPRPGEPNPRPVETPVTRPNVPKPDPTTAPAPRPTVQRPPTRPTASSGVICHLRLENGTMSRVRKGSCNECPPKAACEVSSF